MPTKHDRIVKKCICDHFRWKFHENDMILNNHIYTLDELVLTPYQYETLIYANKKHNFEYKNGLYYRYNTDGEMDIGCISVDNNYALLGEVKSSDNSKARLKAEYQLLKDKQFVEQTYGISRIFGFYITNKELERLI